MAEPSIAMIPSGYKAEKIYSVLPTDGNADLDFARNSKATRINEQGLIEEMAVNVPILDYSDGTCPSLKLQPQSTNLITYSESFGNSYWTKNGASIEGDASTAGVEEVVNGDFATDTDWIKGADWTISGGKASASIPSGSSNFSQNGVLESGKFYTLTFTISDYVTGFIKPLFGGTTSSGDSVPTSGNGTYTYQNLSDGNILYFRGVSFIGSIDNVSVKEVQGFSAPSGDSPLGAFKLVLNNGGEILKSMPFSVGTNYTFSFYAKTQGGTFDFSFGNISYATIGATATNEWKRFEVTQSAVATTRFPKITTSSAGEMLIFGAQLEAQSYATSYIPTSGTVQTRLAETASRSGLSGLINSEEGVLYFESRTNNSNSTAKSVKLSDGGDQNELQLYFYATSINVTFNINGVNQFYASKVITIGDNYKLAVKFKENDFALWVNGVEEVVDSSGIVGVQNLFNKIDLSGFYGNAKDLRVYKTALTDAQLTTLTTI